MGQNQSNAEYRHENYEVIKENVEENVLKDEPTLRDDPRSPSQEIDRTPLRGGSPKHQRKLGEYRKLVNEFDPRSPCGEINRTPIKGLNTTRSSAVNNQCHHGHRLFTNEDNA